MQEAPLAGLGLWHEVILIVGMMLVTFGVRYPLLVLSGRVSMPPWLLEALSYVPIAVLSAIVIPMMLAPDASIDLSADNAYLIAGLFAILVAAVSRQVLTTILAGMVLFFILRWWLV